MVAGDAVEMELSEGGECGSLVCVVEGGGANASVITPSSAGEFCYFLLFCALFVVFVIFVI